MPLRLGAHLWSTLFYLASVVGSQDIPAGVLHILAADCANWTYAEDLAREPLPRNRRLTNFKGSGNDYIVEYHEVKAQKRHLGTQQHQHAILHTVVRGNGKEQKVLVVTFAGTAVLQDWLANLALPTLWDSPLHEVGLGVQAGWYALLSKSSFFRHTSSSSDSLNASLTNDITRWEPDLVLVTGHSLGGALAQIAAVAINYFMLPKLFSVDQVGNIDVYCFTFAAPMPFIKLNETSETVSQKNEKRQNVIEWFGNKKFVLNFMNNNDVVPRLPKYGNFAFGLDGLPMLVIKQMEGLVPFLTSYEPLTHTAKIGHSHRPGVGECNEEKTSSMFLSIYQYLFGGGRSSRGAIASNCIMDDIPFDLIEPTANDNDWMTVLRKDPNVASQLSWLPSLVSVIVDETIKRSNRKSICQSYQSPLLSALIFCTWPMYIVLAFVACLVYRRIHDEQDLTLAPIFIFVIVVFSAMWGKYYTLGQDPNQDSFFFLVLELALWRPIFICWRWLLTVVIYRFVFKSVKELREACKVNINKLRAWINNPTDGVSRFCKHIKDEVKRACGCVRSFCTSMAKRVEMAHAGVDPGKHIPDALEVVGVIVRQFISYLYSSTKQAGKAGRIYASQKLKSQYHTLNIPDSRVEEIVLRVASRVLRHKKQRQQRSPAVQDGTAGHQRRVQSLPPRLRRSGDSIATCCRKNGDGDGDGDGDVRWDLSQWDTEASMVHILAPTILWLYDFYMCSFLAHWTHFVLIVTIAMIPIEMVFNAARVVGSYISTALFITGYATLLDAKNDHQMSTYVCYLLDAYGIQNDVAQCIRNDVMRDDL